MTITLRNDVKITDSNVIEHFKKGNEDVFRFIFDKYYDYLCLIADSYLRDSFISETIVGEIIYNLWEIRENVDIRYSLRSYLIRSVKNRCINYLQQEYVKREVSLNQYEDKAAIEELFFIENKHPLENLLEQELEYKINEVINNLPTECRQVFKMSRFDNMKYEEIADTLSISINTVKYHMKNALMQLRIELRDYLMFILVLLTLI
ncbi:RNA polymerase sigma-70 factor [Coprobacter tertius]|uniref:RNA polymerase sigma-70 factor n=1 Tax=Coprobacter tertius TaxID=2944915 RepID=A0ABT1MJG8_9BACT|nr:RNA polymerase sigma-70 factor [Coprobacter tertius]MCP9612769.1 RNA polymerase sigma-70 factor [Coprobacter tertius]